MEDLPAELPNLQQEVGNESSLRSRQFELPGDSLERARLLAKNPCATPKMLGKLSKSSDATTRFYVATNPNAPIEVLRKLAREFPLQVLSNPVLPLLFLENPHIVDEISLPLTTLSRIVMDAQTSREILGMLVQSKHRKVEEAARLHVNWAGEMTAGWQETAYQAIKTAVFEEQAQLKELEKIGLLPEFFIKNLLSDILEKLALDSRWHIRVIVAENRNVSDKLLEKLAFDEEAWVRRGVAENPNVPANLLEKLALDRDAWVRRAVAENPNVPVSLLEKLALDPDISVRRAVAENAIAPANLLEQLALDESILVQIAVAWNPNTPASLLEQLEKNLDAEKYLAVFPHTPERVLEELAKYGNFIARRNIAKHTLTPVNVLEELAKDIDELSRQNVALNPNTPIAVLESLLDDKEMSVRVVAVEGYLARNPQGLPVVLERYAKKVSSSLSRLLILLHPQTPDKTLLDNCRSHAWLERYAIAQHSNTPIDPLTALVKDGNRVVRAAAKANLESRGL